jgi:TctA family transporter
MMETSFRQSMTISRGDPTIFVRRPFAATLLVIVFLFVVGLTVQKSFRKTGAKS